MIKPIARLVSRSSSATSATDGLLIGTRLTGETFFKPNMVYEILEIDGQHVIREVGTSVIADPNAGENVSDSPVRETWGAPLNHVLCQGKNLFLSREEFAQLNQPCEE
jgi:hypothetical protein